MLIKIWCCLWNRWRHWFLEELQAISAWISSPRLWVSRGRTGDAAQKQIILLHCLYCKLGCYGWGHFKQCFGWLRYSARLYLSQSIQLKKCSRETTKQSSSERPRLELRLPSKWKWPAGTVQNLSCQEHAATGGAIAQIVLQWQQTLNCSAALNFSMGSFYWMPTQKDPSLCMKVLLLTWTEMFWRPFSGSQR